MEMDMVLTPLESLINSGDHFNGTGIATWKVTCF